MTIQELIDQAYARDHDLRIDVWDRLDYSPGKPRTRVTEASVSSVVKGRGSQEAIALYMRDDQVMAVAPGFTTLWWQAAPLQKVLDESLPRAGRGGDES